MTEAKTYGDLLRNPSMLACAAEVIRVTHMRLGQMFIQEEKAMKTYIGIKQIEAEPAIETTPIDDDGNTVTRNGYRVRYDDGYTSWSPAEAFEAAYVEVPEGEAKLILAKLRGDLAVLVESPPEQDAGPLIGNTSGGRDPASEADYRRRDAIRFALDATQPVMSGGGMTSQRTVGQVLDAATKILDFIEGRASLAPSEPPA